MNELANVRAVALNEKVVFRCQLCGNCCRHVADSIMLEPIDAFNLAQYLRKQGEAVEGTEDVLARYTHAGWLSDDLLIPIFLMDTKERSETCVFLEGGRCSVYEARPRVCRLYPFSVGPGSRGRDLQYYLCTEKPQHFSDGMVRVRDWLSQNFPKEDKDVMKADYDALPILSKNITAMDDKQFRRVAFQFLYYRYYNYKLDEPFLPQFRSNLEKLKELTREATV